MAEEKGGERRTLFEVYGDKDNPIVVYIRPKIEVNWRESLLALDVGGINSNTSMMSIVILSFAFNNNLNYNIYKDYFFMK